MSPHKYVVCIVRILARQPLILTYIQYFIYDSQIEPQQTYRNVSYNECTMVTTMVITVI